MRRRLAILGVALVPALAVLFIVRSKQMAKSPIEKVPVQPMEGGQVGPQPSPQPSPTPTPREPGE